jgi:hypothetical protein
MFSTMSLIFLTLIQTAYSLAIAIDQADTTTPLAPRSTLQKRGLTTGVKVALGICVPAASLAVGLGIGIFVMYPAQRRKLRAQNGGANVSFADVMNGKVTQHPPPPPYQANRASSATETAQDGTELPNYPEQPKADTQAAVPAGAETRHAV